MICWVQRMAAGSTGIFLATLLFQSGKPWAGIAGCILNLCLIMDNRLPQPLRRILPPSALGINTVLSVYGVLIGGSADWSVCVVSGSLLSWNTTLFLRRWPQAPLSSQYRYLRYTAAATFLGLGAGHSSLALQGQFYLPFWAAFLLMLAAAALLLRLITCALKGSSGS